MKKIRLSTASERLTAAIIFAVILILAVFLACVMASDIPAFILVLVCGVIAALLVLFYLITVFRAACEVSPGRSTINIKGFLSYTVDISGAAGVKTVKVSNGPFASRSILFLDENGETLKTLPTSFTAHSGAMAEPAAMALSQALGLKFIPALERWEYDRDARKEHNAELARQRKEDRANRPPLKEQLRQFFSGKKTAPKASGLKKEPEAEDEYEFSEADIDYDAMDDEK